MTSLLMYSVVPSAIDCARKVRALVAVVKTKEESVNIKQTATLKTLRNKLKRAKTKFAKCKIQRRVVVLEGQVSVFSLRSCLGF